MSNQQAKLNDMVIATLIDIIANIKEGRENAVEIDMQNHIERIMVEYGTKERLKHTGRRITLELR